MSFDPALAEIRFGTGLSPRVPPPQGVAEMVDSLATPDIIETTVSVPPFPEAVLYTHALRQLRRENRMAMGTEAADETQARLMTLSQDAVELRRQALAATYIRAAETGSGMRERLTAFWADHFTVRAKNFLTQHLVAPYIESAVRPYIAGPFSLLLKQAALHPMMLDYLDQTPSAGPNSQVVERRGGGLNENLARELLELHTIGVGGPYAQVDVRELAELLAGVVWHQDDTDPSYRAQQAEPGAETVLGRTFSPDARLSSVMEALEYLAVHPATAAHVSGKLARAFVSDAPPQDMVDEMAAAWLDTGGHLRAVYTAMLRHPAAWAPARRLVKPPFDFVASALRALGLGQAELGALPADRAWGQLGVPLRAMGQSWEEPVGPDGWPDEPAAWVTPQFYAARIAWAMATPDRLMDLPDPRDFVGAALGPLGSPEVQRAAAAAETRAEGVGVVLASPDFQRR
ncbi:DUF1800 family protein [Pseudoroseicyclus sp. CXY001]|uniref:DUF1800 domain-containing protein n=1 Tax=Pseudoroseicyclus sp. CXY001 TaxID=3242492 RepID=UPI00358DD03F